MIDPVGRGTWSLLVALIAASLLAGCGPERSPYPSVLLISLDTTRRDHLSCYGYERQTTPHIDALAETGLLFTQAVAVSNWTLPTHGSMLTGLYPTTHGAHQVTRDQEKAIPAAPMARMAEDCLTLPEILVDVGFRTAAIVANSYYLQPKLGLTQGFHHYDFRQAGPPLFYRRAEEITGEAIRWLATDPGVPFFLFLNYMDPHAPYLPPSPFDLRFSDPVEDAGLRARFGTWKAFLERTEAVNKGAPFPAEEAAFFRNQYDGELAYTDAQVGRLLAWLRDEGLYDRTLVIVTSDHGEAFGEHGVVGHAATLYEHQLAIPLILKLPFSEAAERIDLRVSQIDIFPSVLEVLGITVPETTQGASVFDRRPRDLFVEQHPQGNGRWSRFAVYRGALKYITYGDGKDVPVDAERAEIYDLGQDPGETVDLGDADGVTREALETSLRGWLARTPTLRQGDAPEVELSDAEQKALRALGYLD